MSAKSSNLVSVGRITAVYGIKGWVKVHSYTEPQDNLFEYHPWWVKTRHGVKQVEIDEARPHGDAYVAHIKGVDDRDLAMAYTAADIAVERDLLPELEDGEYYWNQLEGLSVFTVFGGEQRLGVVTKLLETGANDVLVVQGDAQSIDQRERLIPYVPGQFVLSVDLDSKRILVDWDPEF
ncbi:ribosome maturation factor RimM [Cellvibrio japonicus]|uniref:Ribosome maturation factor RimM n=1 Tax=Cellvibrio japonicus (strain Ueda107) TaxID=498211 RepID=RIMM_CELJU|nr:ribosome maturation factor RimM [Cellvibrio japonicus]B3PDH6.1 RecName: Full=Ribosome maturation factor RimM [Cellvibrio japonicus Ueda107]ACE84515.1 16S rRNA processing protein RimM [Cellvibrio japonicus Ueda107]QEI11998.1 ribosome maturation factor RimM [Cellvibrio japonicus]QEI15572.1 ribosome maturation factor RimM [Cellvibrio japonicus]QEI19151.1 ribosome maturation factor RimM [Cellvibrio japonicus]